MNKDTLYLVVTHIKGTPDCQMELMKAGAIADYYDMQDFTLVDAVYVFMPHLHESGAVTMRKVWLQVTRDDLVGLSQDRFGSQVGVEFRSPRHLPVSKYESLYDKFTAELYATDSEEAAALYDYYIQDPLSWTDKELRESLQEFRLWVDHLLLQSTSKED